MRSPSLFLFSHIVILFSNVQAGAHNRHHHSLHHLRIRSLHSPLDAKITTSENENENFTSIRNATDTSFRFSHIELQKSKGNCEFPSDAGLIAITPDSKNAGWAMSPDQSCEPDSYCPYACPSGQVMAQWNPDAKAYTYPQSMDGGLHCDKNGQIKKPFPEKPYCEQGTGGVIAHNKAGKGVSFCQTVLPGNEAMLIPTHVEEQSDLAVPGEGYWCKTAAHYYINPPGIKSHEACVWGDGSQPVGNWSPYVAGANTDASGQTFVKIGWNPIYTGSRLASSPPNFGVKITCENGGCNGTPCSIDPSSHGVGGVESQNKATGAGGADFCVVTVAKGSKANIEIFSTDKSSGQNHEVATPKNSPQSKPEDKDNLTPSEPNSRPNHDDAKSDQKLENFRTSSTSGSNSSDSTSSHNDTGPSPSPNSVDVLSESEPSSSLAVLNSHKPVSDQIPSASTSQGEVKEKHDDVSLTIPTENTTNKNLENNTSNSPHENARYSQDSNAAENVPPSGEISSAGVSDSLFNESQEFKDHSASEESPIKQHHDPSEDAPSELFEIDNNNAPLAVANTKHSSVSHDSTSNVTESLASTSTIPKISTLLAILLTISPILFSL